MTKRKPDTVAEPDEPDVPAQPPPPRARWRTSERSARDRDGSLPDELDHWTTVREENIA